MNYQSDSQSMPLSEAPRRVLEDIISRYGPDICSSPSQIEGLLRDMCGEYRREINLLLSALKEKVAADLLSASTAPVELLVGRLTTRLRDNHSLTDEAARWAVESWALALGRITRDQLLATAPATAVKPTAPATAVKPMAPATAVKPTAPAIVVTPTAPVASQCDAPSNGGMLPQYSPPKHVVSPVPLGPSTWQPPIDPAPRGATRSDTVNGRQILVLGILSIFCCAFMGPFVLHSSKEALKILDQGYPDQSQRTFVRSGRICAYVSTTLLILGVFRGLVHAFGSH